MEPPIFFNNEHGPTIAFYPLVDDAMTAIVPELMVQGSAGTELWNVKLNREDVTRLATYLEAWLERTEGL